MKKSKTQSLKPQTFLNTSGMARKVAEFRKDEPIYIQGDAAQSVMYSQKGNVKFSVVSATGKVAVVALLGPSDFFGEGCMAGQSVRMGTATAISPTSVLAIDKNELLSMLRTQDKLSDSFVEFILNHKNRVEEALIDQLFNSSEERLARALLALGRYGKVQHQLEDELPTIS
jgi:CRP/FNR family transcriptional regulator, cyclic AMP receptor protein